VEAHLTEEALTIPLFKFLTCRYWMMEMPLFAVILFLASSPTLARLVSAIKHSNCCKLVALLCSHNHNSGLMGPILWASERRKGLVVTRHCHKEMTSPSIQPIDPGKLANLVPPYLRQCVSSLNSSDLRMSFPSHLQTQSKSSLLHNWPP